MPTQSASSDWTDPDRTTKHFERQNASTAINGAKDRCTSPLRAVWVTNFERPRFDPQPRMSCLSWPLSDRSASTRLQSLTASKDPNLFKKLYPFFCFRFMLSRNILVLQLVFYWTWRVYVPHRLRSSWNSVTAVPLYHFFDVLLPLCLSNYVSYLLFKWITNGVLERTPMFKVRITTSIPDYVYSGGVLSPFEFFDHKNFNSHAV